MRRAQTHRLTKSTVPYDGGQSVVVLTTMDDDDQRQRDHL